MKKLVTVLFLAGMISCSKKDLSESKSTTAYQIRIAAIENNGAKSYTPVSTVKAGKVAVEYETAEVANVKEYTVEVSVDGVNFKKVKTITADLSNPNKVYRDTLVLE